MCSATTLFSALAIAGAHGRRDFTGMAHPVDAEKDRDRFWKKLAICLESLLKVIRTGMSRGFLLIHESVWRSTLARVFLIESS